MDKNFKKQEIDDNLVNYELKDILEKQDPEFINRENMSLLLNKIKSKRKIEHKEIAKMILFMADFPERNWNIKNIMEVMKTCLEEINWRDFYSCFLEEDFNIWSLDSLYVIIDCWVCISGIITVPYEIFFKKWKNLRSQIYFIRLIIESDEKKTQLYSNVFFTKIVKIEEIKNSRFKNTLNYESNFNCVELFDCIKNLDSNILIEQISKKSPEWCLVGLSFIYPSFEKIFDELIITFLRGSSNNFVFFILFRQIPKILFRKLTNFISNGISLSKILDVILEQKMLPMISDDLDPPDICLDIIILSSVRDHLNLGIWINNNLISKKDTFAKKLINYLEHKIQDMILDNKNSLIGDKLFPLTVEIIINIVKSIEQTQKHLSFETLTAFNQIKKKIPQILKLKKGVENNIDEQASTFISSIINSQMSIPEGVEFIKKMSKDDVTFKIFSTLIENYNALYKLPNSDLLAIFYGELINFDLIPKPFLKITLSYIKESLAYPECDREFHFAFKCLESFIKKMPKFLGEIEDIKNVKSNLLKKELILVDENFYSQTSFSDFLEIALKIEPKDDLIRKLNELKIKKDLQTFKNINNDDLIYLLIYNLYTEEYPIIYKILGNINENIKVLFISSCLDILKCLLSTMVDKEIDFVKKIGKFLGEVTLAKNRIIFLDKFDFKNFLIKSIEGRRIRLGVSFICNFVKQGKKGKIFIPKNPWLMSLLNLLGDLQTCTLKEIRLEIEDLFSFFDIKLMPRPIGFYKFKTREYLLEYVSSDSNLLTDDVSRHAIFLALDFSIREISDVIIDKAVEIALKTSMNLFKTVQVEKGTEYPLFRNLLINITKSLCHISTQEPIRACMSGNITYFLKLVGIEISPEEVQVIVNDNHEICCNLIQKAGITKIIDVVNEHYKNLEINFGKGSFINLKVLENNTHLEKVYIKPVDATEYQEIKSHFLQISRRKSSSNIDFISEEWHNLLGNDSKKDFDRIKEHIKKSEDKDLECTKLCKYIIGHLIKTENNNDFLYFCLKDIFKISNRTQKEVLNWIIYSNDPRKYTVQFISKFIEYKLINLVEYDQALARSIKIEENLDLILNLITNLITSDIQICTVYDFIALLEALANCSDNSKIYDFFQKISNYMMLFENTNQIEIDKININVKSTFKSAWEHFVRHHKLPSLYCYQKVDMIPNMIKNTVNLYIKDTLEVFIDAYNRRNYLFVKFYTRFITKLLDVLDETPENLKIIYDLLNLLKPSSVPFYTSGYLEIIQHKFIKRFFDFNIAEEVIKVVNTNEKFLYPCTKIFMIYKDNKNFMKVYGIYLSYLCNFKYVHLKNIFNRYRDNIPYLENQNLYFKIRRMLQSNNIQIKDFINNSQFIICIIDNLNEKNLISVYANNILRTFLNEKILIQKIIALVWVYNKGECVPVGLKMFYEEIKKNDWVHKIIDSLEIKFNK